MSTQDGTMTELPLTIFEGSSSEFRALADQTKLEALWAQVEAWRE